MNFNPLLWLQCGILTLTATPALAQSTSVQDLEPQCKAAIFDIERNIENYRRAYVSNVSVYDTQTDADLPTETPLNLLIGLDAYDSQGEGDVVSQSSALDLLESPQMLRNYSEKIIDRCENIVSVNFLLTEYQSRQFGWVNGSVREFRCADSSTTSELPWGSRMCF